jgi:hypothetical protein
MDHFNKIIKKRKKAKSRDFKAAFKNVKDFQASFYRDMKNEINSIGHIVMSARLGGR